MLPTANFVSTFSFFQSDDPDSCCHHGDSLDCPAVLTSKGSTSLRLALCKPNPRGTVCYQQYSNNLDYTGVRSRLPFQQQGYSTCSYPLLPGPLLLPGKRPSAHQVPHQAGDKAHPRQVRRMVLVSLINISRPIPVSVVCSLPLANFQPTPGPASSWRARAAQT